MIRIIYGGKGSGKTTEMLNEANVYAPEAKGFLIYIDKNNSRMHDLTREIRLVDAKEYGTFDRQGQFVAFVNGMSAANYDIERVYIDNLEKIIGSAPEEMSEVYSGLELLSKKRGIDFVITVACEKSRLPDFLSKYITE